MIKSQVYWCFWARHSAAETGWHSAERIPPPRHTEIGTVSLPASSRCVRVTEVG